MPEAPVIVWFRQDLRLADNRALAAATATGAPLILLYILDDEAPGHWALGGASRWWLHGSLEALATQIEKLGGRLVLRRGAARQILPAFAEEAGAQAVYCTRCYEPWAARLEQDLNGALGRKGVVLKRHAGGLIKEPEDLRTKAGEPFKVFTPFWRALLDHGAPAKPVAPPSLQGSRQKVASDKLADWRLRPRGPDWAGGLRESWQPGEQGAADRLDVFLADGLADYACRRDRPDMTGTSRLSPHLHFGEISPHTCWHAAVGRAGRKGGDKGLETFLKELAWREFSYHLLSNWPNLPEKPFREEFSAFPWRRDEAKLKAWQRGATGYPIVDAGMRELWHTGWMHNRVRMIVASFLVKDLLIPWQQGAAWFWDTLVDADLANNSASWQWVAGSGADAAPYFRIFNPVKQGQTFDPAGDYVRRWVPELSGLAAEVIHSPWSATPAMLAVAGIELGKDYPKPIVDHGKARGLALAAFQHIKTAGSE